MVQEEGNEAAVVLAFATRYLDDQMAGEVKELPDYLRDFPDHGVAIARRFEELQAAVGRSEDDRAEVFRRDFGPYRLLHRLGGGGQGDVYLAHDEDHSRLVAIKVLDVFRSRTAARRRFEKEAAILARVKHSNICGFLDRGEHDGVPYIVMEYVAGDSLRRCIKTWRLASDAVDKPDESESAATLSKSGAERRGQIVDWFIDCGYALYALHKLQLVHRDVKPDNIMLTGDSSDGSSPVLVDLGLAQDLDDSAPGVTMTGYVPGTLPYMSPEQIRPDPAAPKLDHRSDVYSLAVSLYEALTLRLPHDGTTSEGIKDAIERDEPTWPRQFDRSIPRDLDRIVRVAMDKSRERRYATAKAFAEDLERFRDGKSILADPPSAPVRVWRMAKRYPVAASVLAATIVFLVAVAELTRRNEGRQRELVSQRNETIENNQLYVFAGRVRDVVDRVDGVSFLPQDIDVARVWLDDAQAVLALRPQLERRLDELRMRGRVAGEGDDVVRDELLSVAERRRVDLAGFLERLENQPARWAKMWKDTAARYRSIPQAQECPDFAGIERMRLQAIRDVGDRHSLAEIQATLLEPYVFDHPKDAREYRLITGILARLAAIEPARRTHPPDVEGSALGSRAQVESRLATAERLSRPTAAWRDAWSDASKRIHKEYDEVEITPISELMPLGCDVDSKFMCEEFLHLPSHVGEPIVRDAEGKLPSVTAQTGLIMVLVPGGEFFRGAQNDDPNASNYDPWSINREGPVEEKTITPFFISKYEMTRGQVRRLFGHDSSLLLPGIQFTNARKWAFIDGTCPAEGISWSDAVRRLPQWGLDLPSEDQWEYAARAGSIYPWRGIAATKRRPLSPTALSHLAAYANLKTPPDQKPRLSDVYSFYSPVGTLEANKFGLHDMIGNLAEWCRDPFSYTYGGPAGRRRVLRGGSFASQYENARHSTRSGALPDNKSDYYGLRPVRRLP